MLALERSWPHTDTKMLDKPAAEFIEDQSLLPLPEDENEIQAQIVSVNSLVKMIIEPPVPTAIVHLEHKRPLCPFSNMF